MLGAGPETVFGLSTAALWGTADFSGGVAAKRASPSLVVLVAHGFSLLVLLGACAALHSYTFNFYGLLGGIFCGAGLLMLYGALARGPMGLSAAVCGVLTATIPVLYAWIREGHPSARKLLGFVLAAGAIWLVSNTPEERHDAEEHPRSLGLAAGAGMSFGAMLILIHIASVNGVLNAIVSMRIGSTLVAALAVAGLWAMGRRLVEGEGGSVFPCFHWRKTLMLALLAGVLDTSGNVLYQLASLAGRLDVAAVLSSLYPAGTMLLAIWLLKERATRNQAAGMALAIAAVALISI
jgi:drug/metabolite transporter (DMT)-like permease